MLRIEITAVHPTQAEGLSVPDQVAMAMSGIGFGRTSGVSVAPGQSISSIDEIEDADEPTTEGEAAKPQPVAAEAPKPRRGRPPKANASEPQVASGTATAASSEPTAPSQDPVPEIRANPEDRKDPEAKPLTHDDLRNALGRLSQKIGLTTAVAEVRALVGGGIQDVPATQEALGAVLAKMEARLAGGEPMAKAVAPLPTLTHLDVKNAIIVYAQKFGQDAAKADWPLLIGFTGKVDDMPSDQDTLGKAVKAVTEGVEANPFGRTPANG